MPIARALLSVESVTPHPPATDLPFRKAESAVALEAYQSSDPAMRACLDLARVAARTELPILILGESGTGKTILARAIHNSSPRAARPFVAFNAAALSDTLLDSQLFGHERGAFTGADRRVKGKFELADRGTLFIDEIADMSRGAQAKILRAIEYGEFERLGGETLLQAEVRLISATHLPIGRYRETDQFRKDLFYRISGITLRVPPLRQRPEDLRALVASEIRWAGVAQGKPISGLSREAADRLLAYAWPGNLRELKRVIQTAVALTEGEVIPAQAVLLEGSNESPLPISEPDPPAATPRSTSAPIRRSVPDLTLHTVELRHIQAVLAETGGNRQRAARLLGIAKSTLKRKLDSLAPDPN